MARRTEKRPKGDRGGGRDLRARIIAAALDLAVSQGWPSVSLNGIAAAAGVRLSDLYSLFPSRQAILAGFSHDIDARVLNDLPPPEAGDTPRDRLFDVLMRRFDALEPHKPAMEALLRVAPRDPLGAICSFATLLQSMAWMLEAAGLPAAGLRGALRAKALAVVYLTVLRTWLSDDSPDKARTMAALDGRLRSAWFCLGSSGHRPAHAA